MSALPADLRISIVAHPSQVEPWYKCRIKSDLLDPRLHKGHEVRARVYPDVETVEGVAAYALTAFQLNSLLRYLNQQEAITSALLSVFSRECAEEEGKESVSEQEALGRLQLQYIEVRPRHIPNIDQLRRMFPGYKPPSNPRACDSDRTQWYVGVIVATDWNDEHWARMEFRDGELVSYARE